MTAGLLRRLALAVKPRALMWPWGYYALAKLAINSANEAMHLREVELEADKDQWPVTSWIHGVYANALESMYREHDRTLLKLAEELGIDLKELQ